jgi:hypothetical protein
VAFLLKLSARPSRCGEARRFAAPPPTSWVSPQTRGCEPLSLDELSHRRGRGRPEAQRSLGPVGAADLPEPLRSRNRSRGKVRLSNKALHLTGGAVTMDASRR